MAIDVLFYRETIYRLGGEFQREERQGSNFSFSHSEWDAL